MSQPIAHHAIAHKDTHHSGGADPLSLGSIAGQLVAAQHPSGLGVNLHHPQLHKDAHKSGGGDAFTVDDLLDAIARVIIRKNTGVDVGKRRRLNLIEGSGVTLTITDDPTDEEVDVTIAAAAAGGVPSGVICMWHGLIANIPSGWLLCDGANGTPDLRARFVRGAPAGQNPGAVGGADSHTHTNPSTESAGAHQHQTPWGDGSKVYALQTAPWGVGDSFSPQYYNSPNTTTLTKNYWKTDSQGAHTHTQGATGSADSRPAYYEVAFIMKS